MTVTQATYVGGSTPADPWASADAASLHLGSHMLAARQARGTAAGDTGDEAEQGAGQATAAPVHQAVGAVVRSALRP